SGHRGAYRFAGFPGASNRIETLVRASMRGVFAMAEMDCDVLVVGGGNAALTSALAAREQGAEVLVLERAPVEERGGNSRFTAGAIRVVYNGLDDLVKLMPDLTDEEKRNSDFGVYTSDQYFDDLARVTQDRANPDMAELLVTRSFDTLLRLRGKGIRFMPMYGRQAFKVDGRMKFWGGLTVEAYGGGPGLIEMLHKALERNGIEVLYGTRAQTLLHDERGVWGVTVRQGHPKFDIEAKAVVLACGGFRIERGMAHALSRAWLGSREGARHALQHRRRHPHGDRHRRDSLWQLVRLPRGRLGSERAGVRRSRGRRQFPEALLSLRPDDQR